jgi:plasmid replication initiation protein
MGETTKRRSPLLPDRRPVPDFFVCDIIDATPKSDQASMEHPVFSVSTKPDLDVRRYENNGGWIEITPSVRGLATVHDRDILIFCISQIMAALNEGKAVSRKLHFKAIDFFITTNRQSGGEAYERLRDALLRLSGTRIETNITTGNQEILDGFGLIDGYKVVRETRDGRMVEIEITLSDWVFNAIEANEVLTIHRNYFRLRKPLERRLYEIARKHCGSKSQWKIGLELLQKKCGSKSTLFEFRRLVRTIVEDDNKHNHMPDYSISFDGRANQVIFTSRGTVPGNSNRVAGHASIGRLDSRAYERARAVAPGWDIYALESEWRDWCAKNQIVPNRPGAHFVGFCRSWDEKRDRR